MLLPPPYFIYFCSVFVLFFVLVWVVLFGRDLLCVVSVLFVVLLVSFSDLFDVVVCFVLCVVSVFVLFFVFSFVLFSFCWSILLRCATRG